MSVLPKGNDFIWFTFLRRIFSSQEYIQFIHISKWLGFIYWIIQVQLHAKYSFPFFMKLACHIFSCKKKCFLKLQRNYEKNIIVVQNCAMKSAILKIDGRWRWSNAKKWIWRNCSFTTHVGTYSIRKLVIPISRCNFFGMTLCMHILTKNHAHLKATLKWGTRVNGDLFRI